MIVEQALQTRLEEPGQLGGLPWEKNWNGSKTRLEGLIHVGQKVFLAGGQSIGRISKLLRDAGGRVSYLVICTARLWGHYKLLPFEDVDDVHFKGISLLIARAKFEELPDYKTDEAIAADVGSAFWDDEILQNTDYKDKGSSGKSN
jgi:hypothetical protein